jgi:hypothetical protein
MLGSIHVLDLNVSVFATMIPVVETLLLARHHIYFLKIIVQTGLACWLPIVRGKYR